MAEVDYRAVLYSLVNGGFLDIKTVREAVKNVQQEELKEARNTEAWQEARRLLTVLNDSIKANGRRPSRVNEAAVSVLERLIRLDGKTYDQIVSVIEWCQGHDFWHTVILSPEKLRKHFDTMLAQQERDGQVRPKVVEQVGLGYVATFDEEAHERVRRESIARPAHINLKSALKGVK